MLIPLKVDVYMPRYSWVNYALMALIVWVSVAGFYNHDLLFNLAGVEVSETYGFENVSVSLTTKDYPLPVLALTSSLLHGGWLHLIGNMLFLWVFGNAINYKFGHASYAGLYLAAAFVGGMAHYLFVGGPCIGASGAINGIMGAFLVFFPRNNVTVFWVLILRRGFCGVGHISSRWLILLWVGWDLLFLALGASMGVALWAHVGGFATGFGIAWLCAAYGWIKPSEDEETLVQIFRGSR